MPSCQKSINLNQSNISEFVAIIMVFMAIKDKMIGDYYLYDQIFAHNLKLSLRYHLNQQGDKKYRLTI